MNEVQWKIINYLTKTYKVVVIGKINMQEIVQTDIYKMIKRIGNMMGHGRFRERLVYKGLIRGCMVIIVNEHYTSKVCSNCGNEKKDLGASKTYNCTKCKKTYDRDANSAKNILMKALTTHE